MSLFLNELNEVNYTFKQYMTVWIGLIFLCVCVCIYLFIYFLRNVFQQLLRDSSGSRALFNGPTNLFFQQNFH